jgi:hypothetical protein
MRSVLLCGVNAILNGHESMDIRPVSLPNFELSRAGGSPSRPG